MGSGAGGACVIGPEPGLATVHRPAARSAETRPRLQRRSRERLGRYTLAWVVFARCDDNVGAGQGLEPALARVAAAFNWTTKRFDKILDRIDNPWVR